MNQGQLKEFVHYNPDTGIFTWLPRSNNQWNSRWAGERAGAINGHGYEFLKIDGRSYRASRLAWLYMTGEWPEKVIDHINRDRADNRFVNLREVTPAENMKNKSRYRNNKSGIAGVRWCKSHQRWMADIRVSGSLVLLGQHEDLFDAVAARKAAEHQYGFM